MAKSPCCNTRQENQARPTVHRTLTDITNTTRQGLGYQSGNKQPLLEPKTPARRSKNDFCGLSVFEDGPEEVQSGMRRPASPPHVRPKSRGGEEDCILGDNRELLGIEEVAEAELPPIQDFADRVSEQDQYWHALGLDDGPDGFGRPEDLAHMLAHGVGTASACFEAEMPSDLWGQDIEGSFESPGSSELNRMVWPSFSSSPKRKLADPLLGAFGLSSSPLLPPLDVDMEIDSGTEEESDVHQDDFARHTPKHRPMVI